jgi:antirestriction protein ArdC
MTHINIQSHHEYSGINLEKLNAVFEQEGYRQKIWGTFRQWKQVGHSVIKGEKGVRLF